MPGVTDTQLLQADAALGVRLPPDYRDFLRAHDGYVVSDEHVYLKVFSLAEMLTWNEDTADLQREVCPGLLRHRRQPRWRGLGLPPRSTAGGPGRHHYLGVGRRLVQAPDFRTFRTQLEAEHDFRWT